MVPLSRAALWAMVCLPALLIGSAGRAEAQYFPGHPAPTYCIPCHQQFTNRTDITQEMPCNNVACHNSRPASGGKRYEIHRRVCDRCHGPFESVPQQRPEDIHQVHRNTSGLPTTRVECTTCHSRSGYLSAIADVPPNFSAPDIIRRPPGTECRTCHPTAGGERLHNIHNPVLPKACKTCHRVELSSDTVQSVVAATFASGPGPPQGAAWPNPLEVLADLFRGISRALAGGRS